MTKLTPNFGFNGQCEEAVSLDQKAFCAELGCLLRDSDAKSQDFSVRPAGLDDAPRSGPVSGGDAGLQRSGRRGIFGSGPGRETF